MGMFVKLDFSLYQIAPNCIRREEQRYRGRLFYEFSVRFVNSLIRVTYQSGETVSNLLKLRLLWIWLFQN